MTRLIGLSGIAALLIYMICAGCSRYTDKRDASTIEMANLLSETAQKMDPVRNAFINDRRLEWLKNQSSPASRLQHMMWRISIAQETLYSGKSEEAIRLLHDIESEIDAGRIHYPDDFPQFVTELLALAYLRLGEQQNCEFDHNSASCLIPIKDGGIHRMPEGSLGAVKYYRKILQYNPDDLHARWLLNIAKMTLGEYPDGLPEELVIPFTEMKKPGIQPFKDIATQLGIDVNGLSGGSIVDDFTGNGYLDILTSSWGIQDQIRFFENNGDGTFSDITRQAGLTGITGGLNIVHADFTNNGYPDVFVIRGAWMGVDGRHPNSLLRNNGDGTFTDVTAEAGLLDFYPTGTAAWGDFDNDGWIDLFVGNEETDGTRHPSFLFRNNADGTFTSVDPDFGLNAGGFVKGAVWGDINNNGFIDLYVSRMGQPNLLFENLGPDAEGNWRFREIAEVAGVTEPLRSFTTLFWDYDNDGYEDIFVSGYFIDPGDIAREYLGIEPLAEMPRLYRNNGNGTFSDITREAGLWKVLYTMGANFGDFNNDGLLDLYFGTGDPDMRALMPNRAFLNNGDGTFSEITIQARLGHLQKGHGVSFADFNNNGHLDIYMNIGGALTGDTYMNALFQNPGNDHNWLSIDLKGNQSNTAAIGARIKVMTADGSRTWHQTVNSGGSFGGSPFRQHIGLGSYNGEVRVIVKWPSGAISDFQNLTTGTIWELLEDGSSKIKTVKTFDYHLTKPGKHRH